MKKKIKVVAAFILNKTKDKFFVAKRAYGFLKGKWELPGGKIEKGETPQEALKREIKEELNTEIKVNEKLSNVIYEYDEFILDMDVFKCEVINGRLDLDNAIHSEEAFLSINHINLDNFCPADKEVIKNIFNLK